MIIPIELNADVSCKTVPQIPIHHKPVSDIGAVHKIQALIGLKPLQAKRWFELAHLKRETEWVDDVGVLYENSVVGSAVIVGLVDKLYMVMEPVLKTAIKNGLEPTKSELIVSGIGIGITDLQV